MSRHIAAGRWRTPLFVVAIVGVIAVSVGVLVVASRTGWFVGADDGRVAVFQGRKDGVLWIGPTMVERSDLTVEDLTDADQQKVERGQDFDTKQQALRYIARLEASLTTTTTSTTTTVPAPTTLPVPTEPTTIVLPTVVPVVPPSTP